MIKRSVGRSRCTTLRYRNGKAVGRRKELRDKEMCKKIRCKSQVKAWLD